MSSAICAPACPYISWTAPPTACIPWPNRPAWSIPAGRQAYLKPEVNLHGYRVDEALSLIDSLLDDAALEGMTSLKIVHGKGTGALRRAIREYLGGHPLVAATQPGEGGAAGGVTIVTLR